MCGLTGFCDFQKKLDAPDLHRAGCRLRHRGPDWQDSTLLETPEACIGLAHTRLSILDLSANGRQPFHSRSGDTVLAYNGEIYNFREIRSELEGKGHQFFTGTDTEVIVEAYEAYGIEAVHRFNGMFALALFDRKKEKLYLLRDRYGVKPLYYSFSGGRLLFGSELKSLNTYPGFDKSPCRAAVALFFKYGYIRAPYSIFENTYKLLPGHYLELDLPSKELKKIKYYDVQDDYDLPKLVISEEEAMDTTRSLLASSFRYRAISDVPTGIFLSGGYDSSLVAAMMQADSTKRIKTFTIGFHEQTYNEAVHAKKIAEFIGTDHQEHYCTADEALEVLCMLPVICDEPLGDSSAIPTVLVSRLARASVTVSLSADGGDELFAGYERYAELYALARREGHTTQHHYRQAAERAVTYFTQQELAQLLPGIDTGIGLYDDLPEIGAANDVINTNLLLDHKTYLVDDILAKVDRASMSVGLEAREPLLDHRLVAFAAQLPSDLKYRAGEKKFLLKRIAHEYIPPALLDRPKAGFTIPLAQWLRTGFSELLHDHIREESLRRHGLVDPAAALKLCKDFMEGRHHDHLQVWFLLVFQMWCDEWL